MPVKRDDRGVTLVELLVAIVILGVIAAPLAGGLYVFFRNSDETTRRLSDSHDAQMLANYFAQDVQSIGLRDWGAVGFPFVKSIETDFAWNAGTLRCGGSDVTRASIRMAWDVIAEGAPTGTVVVAYVVKTVGAVKELHRLVCTGNPGTPDSDVVVVHNLDGTVPVPACFPVACTSAPEIPQSVQWTNVKIKSPGTLSDPLTVTVTGQRRQT